MASSFLRVSNINLFDKVITQMQGAQRRVADAQEIVSTGIKVRTPSDDPSKAGVISVLNNTLTRLDNHTDRMANVKSILAAQENTLASANEIMIRLEELASQSLNDTASQETRDSISKEVFQLRDALVSLANTKVQGSYIYAGGASNSPAFAADAVPYTEPVTPPADPAAVRYTYSPDVDLLATGIDDGAITRSVKIADGQTIRVSTPGDDVFRNAIIQAETLGRALAGYATSFDVNGVPDGLDVAYNLPTERNLQNTAIQGALDGLKLARTTEIDNERIDVGSRYGRVEKFEVLAEQVRGDTLETRSVLRDADIFEAASNLSQLQLGLQATLSAGAQLGRLTLLDFL